MAVILVIEDDPAIRRVLELELGHEGYSVLTAEDGRTGLELAEQGECDLILLDLMLPRMNGLDVCRRLRRSPGAAARCPVIMLTARDAVMDRVTGLDTGADDYLVKPFDIEELLARIRVQLRSGRTEAGEAGEKGEDLLVFEDLTLDRQTRLVRCGGRNVDLTKTEFDLLEYFMVNPSIVLSKERLLEQVWQMTYWEDTNLVEVYILYLRKKLNDPKGRKYIRTVRGVGYVLRSE